jgi:hypothetical protein
MNNMVHALFLILGLGHEKKQKPRKRNAKSFSKSVKQSVKEDIYTIVKKMEAA